MKTLKNINIEYPTEIEINQSIADIYSRLPQKRSKVFTFPKILFTLSSACVLVMFISIAIILFGPNNFKKTERVPQGFQDIASINSSDYIFIGQVISVENIEETSDNSLSKSYVVKPLYALKGDTQEYEHVNIQGNRTWFDSQTVSKSLPQLTQVYVFIVNKDTTSGNFVLREIYNIKQLQGYLVDKDISEQPEHIQQIIRKIEFAVRFPTTSLLYNFLSEYDLEDKQYEPDFYYIEDSVDIRIYYINQEYWLYYKNTASSSYILTYFDSSSSTISISIDSKSEDIIKLDISVEEPKEIKLDGQVIGNVTPKNNK